MKVKKEYLLLIAGMAWIIAGISVAKIGINYYDKYLNVLNICLSISVFLIFFLLIFKKMVFKHRLRIINYLDSYQSIFKFFDIKSYIIMAFMMSMGITLRSMTFVSREFIAVFYTGLGLALFLAGVLFVSNFYDLKFKVFNKGENKMKKYINIAFLYAILSMVCGVFYREFTKMQNFNGKTVLAVAHVHFFALGTIVFLIIGLFSLLTNLEQQKAFNKFMLVYNVGLPFMVSMFIARGILQVLNVTLSRGLGYALAGISGVSHILMGVSLVLLFIALRNTVKN